MKRSVSERKADVERFVDAARGVARDRGALVGDLVATTGLSPEGVELAFARHLELDPTDDELESLVAAAGDAKHVVVILSSNVFPAALRAIAIARAASPSVVVRPSRREPHFARALVEHARDPGLSLAADVDLARIFGGEVHVYGRDATIAAVRAGVGERIRVRGHGAGMGIAVVSERASLELAAAALAADVVAFDQRGCLSPRAAIVVGEALRATQFGAALHAALEEVGARVPRGVVHEDERIEAARYEATMAFVGQVHKGTGHLVGVGPEEGPLVVPPTGRHVHVISAPTIDSARERIAGLAPVIVTVGCDDRILAETLSPPHARVSALGEMQRPRFDGPVDKRPG